MTTAENPTFQPSPSDIRALGRATRWSIGVHVGVVLIFFLVPRGWLTKPPRPLMTITLGGTPGPRSTGMTSIGGRTVEEVAPPPKRPEPVPQTSKNESDVVPAKTPTPPAKPAPSAKPQPQPTRPVTTGPQVTSGHWSEGTRRRSHVRRRRYGRRDEGDGVLLPRVSPGADGAHRRTLGQEPAGKRDDRAQIHDHEGRTDQRRAGHEAERERH